MTFSCVYFPLSHTPQINQGDKKTYLFHKVYSLAVLFVLCTLTTGTPGPVLGREEKQRKGEVVCTLQFSDKDWEHQLPHKTGSWKLQTHNSLQAQQELHWYLLEMTQAGLQVQQSVKQTLPSACSAAQTLHPERTFLFFFSLIISMFYF